MTKTLTAYVSPEKDGILTFPLPPSVLCLCCTRRVVRTNTTSDCRAPCRLSDLCIIAAPSDANQPPGCNVIAIQQIISVCLSGGTNAHKLPRWNGITYHAVIAQEQNQSAIKAIL